LTGPSGAGKKTLQHILCRRYPALCTPIIPYTARDPCAHERHDIDFYFVTPALFQQYTNTPRFFTEVYTHKGHTYGINLTRYRDPTKVTLCILTPAGCERARQYNQPNLIFGITAPLQSLLQRLIHPNVQQLIRAQHYLEQAQIIRILNADGQSNAACDAIIAYFCQRLLTT